MSDHEKSERDTEASKGQEPVSSPCISHCTLDDNDICVGCYRSLMEIVDWTMLSDEKKRQVLAKTEQRRAERG